MTRATSARAGLLIGHGSIGRHHLTVLNDRFDLLGVVDQWESSRQNALDKVPGALVAGALSELGNDWPWNRTTAVVATWGPSHKALVEELVQRGVRRILVEKPLATSVSAANQLRQLADESGARIGVHLHYRYSGVVQALKGLAAESELGEPQQIVVRGGARCLVTNGIHYLDLAAALFGCFPSKVISTAKGDPINPRTSDVEYFGGTAVWSFGGAREAVISFPNTSTLYEDVDVYYQHGLLQLSVYLDTVVRRRSDVDLDAPITRSGPATDETFRGPLPGVDPLPVATARILDELEGEGELTLSLTEAVLGVSAIIGALHSGATGCAVSLPLEASSPEGEHEWPMS